MAERVSNARLAMGGSVPKIHLRFVIKTVLNTLAPEQVIPVVRDSLVAESIRHVIVQQIMRGTGAVAPFLVRLLINTPVPVPATPVVQALPVAANILNARVQAVMSGRMGNARKRL